MAHIDKGSPLAVCGRLDLWREPLLYDSVALGHKYMAIVMHRGLSSLCRLSSEVRRECEVIITQLRSAAGIEIPIDQGFVFPDLGPVPQTRGCGVGARSSPFFCYCVDWEIICSLCTHLPDFTTKI
jgi:hypothetical protein